MDHIEAGIAPPQSYELNGGLVAGTAIDLHATPTTAAFPLGQKLEAQDGRRFRYLQAKGVLTAGHLIGPDMTDPTTALDDTNAAVDGTQTGYAGCSEAIGSKKFFVDEGSFTATALNQYSGGFLITMGDTGEGFTYRIKGNTAFAATDEVTFDLFEGLVVALDTTTDIGIIPNPWSECVHADAGADDFCSGVVCSTLADNDFGWCCTWGPTAMFQAGTVAAGDEVYLSATVGCAEALTLVTATQATAQTAALAVSGMGGSQRVGFSAIAGDDTEFMGAIAQIW